MPAWINYHHLLYFKTIAEVGSVSKAAEKLRLGQPTLSAQLKQLEEAMGMKLFLRAHRKLVLTEHGKIAFNYAQSIFQLGSEMYEVLRDQAKPQKLSLCIGSLDSVPKQVTLQIMQSALSFAPCQITLLEGSSEQLLRELREHRIDILISNFVPTGTPGKGLRHVQFSRKPVSFYGAPKYQHLKQNFPQSISKKPVIFPTFHSQLRHGLDQWGHAQKIEYNVVVESQDIATKELMAVQGLGLIPSTEHGVAAQLIRGELIEIGRLTGVWEELHLIYTKRKIENPVMTHLAKAFPSHYTATPKMPQP